MSHLTRISHLAVALFFCATLAARADAPPSVTAVLSSSETTLGRPVQLQIKVVGSSDAKPPDTIPVDGLDIRYSGQSQMMEGRNFHFTYSFVYVYTIMPQRAGTFKIPSQTLHAGIDTLHTPELTLHVADAPNRSTTAPPTRGSTTAPMDEKKLAFAELIVTKKVAYVGEMVPVEVRIGFNTRARTRLTEGAQIEGQGFTAQKMPQPQQDVQEVNGVAYEVLTYKTAIAAARSGKFEVGPATAKALMQVPRAGGGRRSPFDVFNMDDPFSDPFFNNPFSGASEQKEITVKSDPVTIEVKNLPPNAPPSFAGAVGQYTLAADANPKKAQTGDPITVTATISGRGNFDRVTAPQLEDDRGWHKYPPNAKFKQDDDIGISGTKSFELVLTANEPKQAVPPLVFSYFDPLKEGYTTIRSDRLPVAIEGNAVAVVPPAGASSAPAPSSAPPPIVRKADDILYQLTDPPAWDQSFTPVYQRATFWLPQIAPLVALLGFAGLKSRQRRRDDLAAQRIAVWQHEAAERERKLRREDAAPEDFFADATRAIQLRVALAQGIDPHAVDATTAAAAFPLDVEIGGRIRALFDRHEELRYSGRQNGSAQAAVPAETRSEVLDLLSRMQKERS